MVVDTRQTWKNFQYTEDYNPTCNLKWVGREVHDALGTFATKIDLGIRCTGLVNEVLNYWLSKMNDDKFLQEQWKNFSDATAPNCNANRRERRLSGTGRKLKGGEDGCHNFECPICQR